MKKVLISGINGFVGANLSSFLKNRYAVSGLSRTMFNGSNEPPAVFTWEALDLIKSQDFDVIIHLAGKAHDLKKTVDPNEYFEANYEKTRELFDMFLSSEVNDFIYFSSVKAVADTVEGVLKEDVTPHPVTPYGQSKHKAEEYLLSKALPASKRLFIIRPCMIHGPGNKGNLNLLFKVVEKGIPYPLAVFKNERSFLSVDNLNYIIERIVSDSSIPGGVYNVADDEALSTNEVIRIISKAIGSKAKLWNINPSIIRTLAAIGDKLYLPLNSERLKKLTESYVVSNDKIKRALEIKQLPLPADQGLLKTIQSFRSI